jgi:hypothetical protein
MTMTLPAPPSPWLRLARVVLLALVAASALAVLASLMLAPAHLARNINDYVTNDEWSPAMIQAALNELGWPATTVAWFEYLRTLGLYLGFLGPGLFILRRKANDWFGLYLAFAFAFFPALTMLDPLIPLLPALGQLSGLAGALSWQFFFITFYFFPDGVFVPRWTRWLMPVWVGLNVVTLSYGSQSATPAWVGLAFVPLVLLAAGSQVYRYIRWSNAVQRQQTKLVVVAMATLAVIIPIAFSLPGPAASGLSLGVALQLHLARLVVLNLWFVLVPIAIVVAILRYRLWDIDVLIRRTLVYSVLTALLALVYFGSVVVLQGLLRGVIGGQSQVAIVLSTLVIAALFVPLRARVQRAIDRRFFRRKYDAARTLAAFGAQARDETDLAQLSDKLQQTVQDAMQPAHVGLWLRPADRPERR